MRDWGRLLEAAEKAVAPGGARSTLEERMESDPYGGFGTMRLACTTSYARFFEDELDALQAGPLPTHARHRAQGVEP